jgi:hypothetical protein
MFIVYSNAFSQEKSTVDPAKKKFTLSGTVDGRNNETLLSNYLLP